jgi:hypothetical protein
MSVDADDLAELGYEHHFGGVVEGGSGFVSQAVGFEFAPDYVQGACIGILLSFGSVVAVAGTERHEETRDTARTQLTMDGGEGAAFEFLFGHVADPDGCWRSHGFLLCNQSTGFTANGESPG